MFSEEDVLEIFRLFPPQKTADFLPSLILSSGGRAFVTLEFVQAQFRSRVTKEKQRISVQSLASDLDVDPELVRQLVRNHPGLALLSADDSNIITIDERDALQIQLADALSHGVVLKPEFAKQNDLNLQSMDVLLRQVEGQLVESDDHVWSKTYEATISEAILNLLKRSLHEVQSIEILSKELPGFPAVWFVLRILKNVLSSGGMADEFHIQETSDGIQCTPKKLKQHTRDTIVNDLQHGRRAYIDLQAFWTDFPELYSSIEDTKQNLRNSADVEVISSFAVSSTWTTRCVKECVKALQDDGRIDLAQRVSSSFPTSLVDHMVQEMADSISAVMQQENSMPIYQFGNFIVSSTTYDNDRRTLFGYAEADAISQWQQLKELPEKDVKYSISNITANITDDQPVLSALSVDKAIEKAIEEHFWATITSQELENESAFCNFWTERVVTRCRIYNDGLSTIEDQKLRDQLAELFASYAQKELLSDSIERARAQGLVLSRRTRKNISRLEGILKGNKLDMHGVLTALDKFNKKQGVEAPDTAVLEETKKTMVSDMVRRMQKQKQSDGPVLFLTLVLILFAKHFHGAVYATGKFAPKLLKQLKAVLPAEQYEKVEKWKEAAKTSSLSAEDRADMKSMAEA